MPKRRPSSLVSGCFPKLHVGDKLRNVSSMISRSHKFYFGQFPLCEIMYMTVKKTNNHMESMFMLGSLHCDINTCTFWAVCICLIFVCLTIFDKTRTCYTKKPVPARLRTQKFYPLASSILLDIIGYLTWSTRTSGLPRGVCVGCVRRDHHWSGRPAGRADDEADKRPSY